MIQDAINFTGLAATQSDRWLFICALVVIGIIVCFGFKYFVSQNKALMEDHKVSREEHNKALSTIVSDQNETTKSLVVCLDRNTVALNKVDTALTECSTELRHCRDIRK